MFASRWQRASMFPHSRWNKQQNGVGIAALCGRAGLSRPYSEAGCLTSIVTEGIAAAGCTVPILPAAVDPMHSGRMDSTFIVARRAALPKARCRRAGRSPVEVPFVVASFPLGGSPRRAATRMGFRGPPLGESRASNSAGGG